MKHVIRLYNPSDEEIAKKLTEGYQIVAAFSEVCNIFIRETYVTSEIYSQHVFVFAK